LLSGEVTVQSRDVRCRNQPPASPGDVTIGDSIIRRLLCGYTMFHVLTNSRGRGKGMASSDSSLATQLLLAALSLSGAKTLI